MIEKFKLFETPNNLLGLSDDGCVINKGDWNSVKNYVFSYYDVKDVTYFHVMENDMHSNLLIDFEDEYDKVTSETYYGRGEYAGRLFPDDKIISFWFFPEDKDMLKQICRDLEVQTDLVIWDDPEYKIEVTTKDNSSYIAPSVGVWGVGVSYDLENLWLIPLKDYINSGEWKEEEIKAPHLMDPEAKKKMLMKKGYRAKTSKWKKHMKPFESFKLNEIGEANLKPYEIYDHKVMQQPMGGNSDNYLFKTESGLKYCFNIIPETNHFYFPEYAIDNCDVVDDTAEDFYETTAALSFFIYKTSIENIFSGREQFNDEEVVNRGEMFKIMSTIKTQLEKYLQENNQIKYLFLGGAGDDTKKDQRTNLYVKYITKNQPNWEIGQIYVPYKQDYFPIIKIK